jgi:hypothetical protein
MLTSRRRALLEKVIVALVVKKFPAFFWSQKVYDHLHKSLPLDPFPGQMNSYKS